MKLEKLNKLVLKNSSKQDIHKILKIFSTFKKIQDEDSKLMVLNSYKGLTIINNAKVVDVNTRFKTISIKTNSVQAKAMKIEGKTFINSELFEKDIFAKVKYVDMNRFIATVHGFIELENSLRFRKEVRVKVDSHLPVELYFKDFSMTAPILDISTHSIAIQIVKLREELNSNMLFDVKFKLSITNSKQLATIRCKGEIVKVIEEENKFRIVVRIFPDDIDEKTILEFLSFKQKELIQEFKDNF